MAFVWPGPTLFVLVVMFGAYALVDGATMHVALIRGDALARRDACLDQLAPGHLGARSGRRRPPPAALLQ